MPRDANGNYTLPAGNPVVTQTLITSNWANTTLQDVASALTDSLSKTIGGTVSGPINFTGNVTPGYVKKAGDTMTGALSVPATITITPSGNYADLVFGSSNVAVLARNVATNVFYFSNAGNTLAVWNCDNAGNVSQGGGVNCGGSVVAAGASFSAQVIMQNQVQTEWLYNNGNAIISFRGDTGMVGGGFINSAQNNWLLTIKDSGAVACPMGSFTAGGNVYANGGSAYLQTNGDIGGSVWNGGTLSAWLGQNVTNKHTQIHYGSTGTAEFGAVAGNVAQTVDVGDPWVMTGLRTVASAGWIYVRGSWLATP